MPNVDRCPREGFANSPPRIRARTARGFRWLCEVPPRRAHSKRACGNSPMRWSQFRQGSAPVVNQFGADRDYDETGCVPDSATARRRLMVIRWVLDQGSRCSRLPERDSSLWPASQATKAARSEKMASA